MSAFFVPNADTIRNAARHVILVRERLRGAPGMVAYRLALWGLDDACEIVSRMHSPSRRLRAKTRALVTFDRRITGRAYLP